MGSVFMVKVFQVLLESINMQVLQSIHAFQVSKVLQVLLVSINVFLLSIGLQSLEACTINKYFFFSLLRSLESLAHFRI